MKNIIRVIFVEARTGMYLSKDPCSCYCVGGKNENKFTSWEGKKVPATSQRLYSREESDSGIKLPLKSACELNHICKSGSFYVTLVDDGAHRRTHRGAQIRLLTQIHGRTGRLFCCQLSACSGSPHLSVSLPVCRSSPLASSVSLLPPKDGTRYYVFYAFIDFIYF